MKRELSRRWWRVVLAVTVAVAVWGATTLRRESPPDLLPQPGRTMADRFLFSVYPGGHTGETPAVKPADPALVLDRIKALQGEGPPLNVHLYSAWQDVAQDWFWPFYDAEYARYAGAGLLVTLTIRYVPPTGRAADAAGFAAFCRDVVRRYGASPAALRFVIGNEANATGNPDASDGPFPGVREAIVRGVVAASEERDRLGSAAEIGINLAVTGGGAEAEFLRDLVRLGGAAFQSRVAFVGVDVYPGIWPVGSGNAYRDMRAHLGDVRAALATAGLDRRVKLDVLENGFPTDDEHDQAERLSEMVQAVLECRDEFGVVAYSWFDLFDADSASPDRFAHYGLLRSDLTPKSAYVRYREIIAEAARDAGSAGERRPGRPP